MQDGTKCLVAKIDICGKKKRKSFFLLEKTKVKKVYQVKNHCLIKTGCFLFLTTQVNMDFG